MSKTERELFAEEVKKNREVFELILPKLIDENSHGKYVLMHNGEIKATLKDFNDAVVMGKTLFSDKPFSIEQITNESNDLGFYSL